MVNIKTDYRTDIQQKKVSIKTENNFSSVGVNLRTEIKTWNNLHILKDSNNYEKYDISII